MPVTDPKGPPRIHEPNLGEESFLGAGHEGGAPQAGNPAMALPTPHLQTGGSAGGSHPQSWEMRHRTSSVRLPGSPGCALLPRTLGVENIPRTRAPGHQRELRPQLLYGTLEPQRSHAAHQLVKGGKELPSGTLKPSPRPHAQGPESQGPSLLPGLRRRDTKPLPAALGVAWQPPLQTLGIPAKIRMPSCRDWGALR